MVDTVAWPQAPLVRPTTHWLAAENLARELGGGFDGHHWHGQLPSADDVSQVQGLAAAGGLVPTHSERPASPEEPVPEPPVFQPGVLRRGSWGAALDGLFEQATQEPPDGPLVPWSLDAEPSSFSYRDALGDTNQLSRTVYLAVLPNDYGGSSAPTQVLTHEGTWEVEFSAHGLAPTDLDDTPVRAVLAFCSRASASHGDQMPEVGLDGDLFGSRRGRRSRRRWPLSFALVRSCSRADNLTRDLSEPCTVCLEDLRAGQRVRTFPCFHRLHDRCSAKYFRTPGILPLCPVCRSYLGMYM